MPLTYPRSGGPPQACSLSGAGARSSIRRPSSSRSGRLRRPRGEPRRHRPRRRSCPTANPRGPRRRKRGPRPHRRGGPAGGRASRRRGRRSACSTARRGGGEASAKRRARSPKASASVASRTAAVRATRSAENRAARAGSAAISQRSRSRSSSAARPTRSACARRSSWSTKPSRRSSERIPDGRDLIAPQGGRRRGRGGVPDQFDLQQSGGRIDRDQPGPETAGDLFAEPIAAEAVGETTVFQRGRVEAQVDERAQAPVRVGIEADGGDLPDRDAFARAPACRWKCLRRRTADGRRR